MEAARTQDGDADVRNAIGGHVAVSSRRARILSPSARDALKKLRRICAAIGDCEERTSFGHPTFRVGGRSFTVIDHSSGADCLWLRIDPTRRSELLRDPGWFASPYDRG
jgi:hypothetical protein